MDELREIIQEAWCAGNKLETGDTFGAFLDRAANAISEAGYRKVEGKLVRSSQNDYKNPDIIGFISDEW